MSTKTALSTRTRIDHLASSLAAWDTAYHNGEKPLVSDAVYDRTKDELRKLDPGHAQLAEVGAAPAKGSKLQKVKHPTPMGSLDNVFEATEIHSFVEATNAGLKEHGLSPALSWICQPKLDGVSIDCVYAKGNLTHAITRGRGAMVEGEDITDNIRRSRRFPETLTVPLNCQIIGEAMLTKKAFKEHFAEFSNPRAACAGTVRRTDGDGVEHLRVYVFKILPIGKESTQALLSIDTEAKVLDYLKVLGFTYTPPTDTITVTKASPNEASIAIVEAWKTALTNRPTLPYEVDGHVVKVNSLKKARALGIKNQCPVAQRAMKWRGQQIAEAVITGLFISVGRTGKLTPYAVFCPTLCGGSQVSRASMFNWDEVAHLGAGLGARVLMEKEGDIIPRVKAVLVPPAEVFTRPASCPSCGKSTDIRGPESYCLNADCAARQSRNVANWLNQRKVMFLGDETLDRLMALDGPVQSIADLYRLDQDTLAEACGSHIVARKILGELEKSKDMTLAEFVGSVGVPGLMEQTAGAIIATLGLTNLKGFLALTEADLLKVPGFADTKALKVIDGLAVHAESLRDLRKLIRLKQQAVGALTGTSWCCTGPTELNRDRIIELIKAAGGVYKSSVVNGLTYLIMADPESTSNKAEDARRKGVKCIGEIEALKMVGFTG